MGYPNGYCQKDCATDGDCPSDAICVSSQCRRKCQMTSQCRVAEGYLCRPGGTGSVCDVATNDDGGMP